MNKVRGGNLPTATASVHPHVHKNKWKVDSHLELEKSVIYGSCSVNAFTGGLAVKGTGCGGKSRFQLWL